jgi:ribonuclease HII
MRDLAKIYPVYNWDKNKGYPNKSHIQSLIDYGVCHLHRKTYEPIKSLIKKGFDKEKVKSKYGLI